MLDPDKMSNPTETSQGFAAEVERLFHAVADLSNDDQRYALNRSTVAPEVVAEVNALLLWADRAKEHGGFDCAKGHGIRMGILSQRPRPQSDLSKIDAGTGCWLIQQANDPVVADSIRCVQPPDAGWLRIAFEQVHLKKCGALGSGIPNLPPHDAPAPPHEVATRCKAPYLLMALLPSHLRSGVHGRIPATLMLRRQSLRQVDRERVPNDGSSLQHLALEMAEGHVIDQHGRLMARVVDFGMAVFEPQAAGVSGTSEVGSVFGTTAETVPGPLTPGVSERRLLDGGSLLGLVLDEHLMGWLPVCRDDSQTPLTSCRSRPRSQTWRQLSLRSEASPPVSPISLSLHVVPRPQENGPD